MDQAPGDVDPVDRAHLTGRARPSPPIARYAPSAELDDLVERYWIPVWSVPAPSTQSTLQYPVCLMVISNTYARFYGVARGLSSVVLEGDGWAVGTMFTPAAGRLVLGRSVATVLDRHLELDAVLGVDAEPLVAAIHAAMSADPTAETSHRAAIAALEQRFARHLPVDHQGLVLNQMIAWLREHPEVTRVDELAAAFSLSERSLHRLVAARIGTTPKWLIQRRRLHDAVVRLKTGDVTLADVAAELHYVDQAHFTSDFRRATGMTPGEYLADQSG